MSNLKWFAGGSERSHEAIVIIDQLLQDIDDRPQLVPLKKRLVIFKTQLRDGGTSVPFVLSQMNVAIADVLIEHKLHLSESQSKQIKKLRDLSNIRYGY